jgi:hypothetical protein
MGDAPSMLDFRHELYRRFGPAAVGFSADGREVLFMAPIEAGLGVGGFAVLEPDGEGPAVALQLRETSLVEREGPSLDLRIESDAVEGLVGTANARPLIRAIAGSGAVLGTLTPADGSGTSDGTTFARTDQVAPFGERPIRAATAEEIATIAEGLTAGVPAIEIGVLRQTPEVAAHLVSKGFARHTFMCGQSGSGKTYTTGGLFERLLAETTLPIVVLDPNSDHVHLGGLRDPDDTSPAAERFRRAAAGVRVARARGLDSSFTLCADFSDLRLEWQALLLRLHPVDDADQYDALRRLTESLTAPYSAQDVYEAALSAESEDPDARRIRQRIGNLGIADWTLWRRDGESSIAQHQLRGDRCVVLDLGSLPTPDERTAVALALLGARWEHRARRSPVLIAIDEAHNVLPAHTDDPLLAAATELGVLIAGEGRKFGLHLFVATQRPSKVHPNVVSQCDNLLLMRMNGARDVADLESLFSHVPAPMLRAALGFGLGQALIAGPISPVPMFVQVGARLSPEGGSDVPTTWARPADGT